MARTTLLRKKRSQIVCLPEDVAFPGGVRDVVVLRQGVRRVIVPANALWDDFFEEPGVDLGERDQTAAQERDAL